jgi:alkylation response protein AidB-like acyl-CoA dehydrogenase
MSLLSHKKSDDAVPVDTETVRTFTPANHCTECSAGLLSGMVIGLPPVLNFGSDELKARVVPEVLQGKKFICLAVSEAHAGSDVMGLQVRHSFLLPFRPSDREAVQTTAVKSEDGKEWIINGKHYSVSVRFWAINSSRYQEMDHKRNVSQLTPLCFPCAHVHSFCDYFTVGCKTEDGFTVILVERGPGVETKHIKTSYSSAAGTAYVTLDNARFFFLSFTQFETLNVT